MPRLKKSYRAAANAALVRFDPITKEVIKPPRAKRQEEKAFQNQVMAFARQHLWLPYHTHDSRRSEPGFPDLTLVKAGDASTNGGGVIFAELKSEDGKLTKEQKKWKDVLEACPGVRYFLWRPDDYNEAVKVLRDPSRKVFVLNDD